MKSSRKLLCVFCVAIVALAATASAQAYTRPTDPSYVGIVGCWKNGGVETVPSNTPITVFAGWTATNRGLVLDWLHAATNTLSVNGGPAIDLTPYFAGLTQGWDPNNPDYWSDIFFYPIGELAVGQSLTVAWTVSTSRAIFDGIARYPAGTATFTCTVLGA